MKWNWSFVDVLRRKPIYYHYHYYHGVSKELIDNVSSKWIQYTTASRYWISYHYGVKRAHSFLFISQFLPSWSTANWHPPASSYLMLYMVKIPNHHTHTWVLYKHIHKAGQKQLYMMILCAVELQFQVNFV